MGLTRIQGYAALAVGAAALYAVWRMKGLGVENVTAGAINAVGDAATGAVLGVGDVLGIPRTDRNEGEIAWQEGRYWDASFKLPAGTFIGHVWDEITGPKAKTPPGDVPPFNPTDLYMY